MKKIRVLIVDDSAFARKVIREVLARDPEIEVLGIARDGLEALEKIAELKPDVITLDLIMPDLDGIGLLKSLPKDNFPKVIVVSVSGANTDLAIEALERGAVDIVTKPTAQATDRLYEIGGALLDKIKAVANAKPRVVPTATKEIELSDFSPLKTSREKMDLVVIGTSTGGPQALHQLFKALPADLPVPIAVALHIPPGYTPALAERISSVSKVKLVEAKDGMELVAGQAVIAPGGLHLKIRSEEGRLFAVVTSLPLETAHHPSVDVLFHSAAALPGITTLGVVLTGMGNDGESGAKAIHKAGGRVVAESAASCVVYGMPRSVIEAGWANSQALLEDMPGLIVANIYGVDTPVVFSSH
jgi:two-component system, chemotaxis family, protein-glutamate methylesterase/glutaminase